MTKQIDQMRTALGYAREKLGLYRAKHTGEYVGGVEYTALIRMIDDALRPAAEPAAIRSWLCIECGNASAVLCSQCASVATESTK